MALAPVGFDNLVTAFEMRLRGGIVASASKIPHTSNHRSRPRRASATPSGPGSTVMAVPAVGGLLVATGSDHYIQVREPDLVITATRLVTGRTRRT